MSASHSTASSQTPAVRIGAIGVGKRLTHVLQNLLAQDPAFSLTALHDPDAQSVEAARKALAPNAVVCGSAEELCARDDVDWVFIGSWNCYHAKDTQAAFEAGKHVFCEKPLAISLDEARAMKAARKSESSVFALGLVLRYSPLYRKAKELLDEGAIGKLISFEFNETLTFNHGGYIHGNWRRKRSLAGTHLLEKCCHDLDLALWLTNTRPTRVASFGGRSFFRSENASQIDRVGPDPETGKTAFRSWPDPHGINPFNDDKDIVDHQVAILECADGVRGTFHTNCNAAIPERRFYLLGSEGTLRLDATSGRIEHRRIGWNQPVTPYTLTQGDGHANGDGRMAEAMADVLRNKREPYAGFAEGVRSLALADAIDTAMDEGRIVDLEPTWAGLEKEFGPLFTK